MSKRPRPPDDLPTGNGRSGSAAACPPDGDRPGLSAILASHWAVILKRFRDYIHK